jgi:type II secretory pathway component PulL
MAFSRGYLQCDNSPVNALSISPANNSSIAIPDALCVLRRASTLSVIRANCDWIWRRGKKYFWLFVKSVGTLKGSDKRIYDQVNTLV